MVTREKSGGSGWQHLVVRYDGSGRAAGLSIFLNGLSVPLEVVRDSLSGTIDSSEPLRIGRRDEGLGYYGLLDEFHWLPQGLSEAEVGAWFRNERLRGILERPASERT
ncbi:MAG: LamG-like jellyroll fold domain-containing protein, partial [Planctomycetaceae bacterium]